ncbi:MAG: type 4a pilus biogenesis protein PilO, partial [Pseudomonadales bacterium]|nr:type 4a pilus biogenesis protein PilO [Pseudomonadales bacterium]
MSLQESLDKLKNFDPSELDPESIGTWPFPVKALIWLLVFGGVVFGCYKFKLQELHQTLVRAESKELDLRSEFEQKVNEAANLEAYRQQMTEMEESFKALLGQLPQDTEVPGLLEDISDKGVDSGLTFNAIDLKPEKSAEFYIELPIDIDVTG